MGRWNEVTYMNNKLFFLAFMVIAVIIYGCREEEPLGEITVELTIEESNEILGSSGGFRDKLRGNGLGGPMGILFQFSSRPTDGKNVGGGRSEDQSVLLSLREMYHLNNQKKGRVATDSSNTDLPDCLTESFHLNPDGSYKYEIDFGEGCDFFGTLLKGKIVETGRYYSNTFNSTMEFIGFGGVDWTLNGLDRFNGTVYSEYETIEDSVVLTDWSVVYTYNSAFDESRIEDEETVSLAYSATGTERVNDSSWEVRFGTYAYKYETGEKHTAYVVEPLLMHYGCNDLFNVNTFISGIENVGFYSDEETIEFSIDYGNETCDNIVIITQNGISEEIDINELD